MRYYLLIGLFIGLLVSTVGCKKPQTTDAGTTDGMEETVTDETAEGEHIPVVSGTETEPEERKASNSELLGKWELEEMEAEGVRMAVAQLGAESYIHFKEDGVFESMSNSSGKAAISNGTYALQGNRLVVTEDDGKEQKKITMKLESVSKDKLVVSMKEENNTIKMFYKLSN